MALGFDTSRGTSIRNTKIKVYYINGILRETREKIDRPSKFSPFTYSLFAVLFLIIGIFGIFLKSFLFAYGFLFLSTISIIIMLIFKLWSLKIMKSPPNQFENIVDEDEVFDSLYERFGTKYDI